MVHCQPETWLGPGRLALDQSGSGWGESLSLKCVFVYIDMFAVRNRDIRESNLTGILCGISYFHLTRCNS